MKEKDNRAFGERLHEEENTVKLMKDPRYNEYKKIETRTDRFLDRHCSRPVSVGKAASDVQYMSPMLTAFARR